METIPQNDDDDDDDDADDDDEDQPQYTWLSATQNLVYIYFLCTSRSTASC